MIRFAGHPEKAFIGKLTHLWRFIREFAPFPACEEKKTGPGQGIMYFGPIGNMDKHIAPRSISYAVAEIFIEWMLLFKFSCALLILPMLPIPGI